MANFDPTRVLGDELFVGQRADFHVYYRHNGKPKVDAAYGDKPEQFIRSRRRGTVEIIKIVKTEGALV